MRQPKIRYSHWFFRLWFMRDYGAITLWPYILFRRSSDRVSERMMAHEMVHWEQIRRCGVIRFYLRYLWYSAKYGYKDNPFEREASQRTESLRARSPLPDEEQL